MKILPALLLLAVAALTSRAADVEVSRTLIDEIRPGLGYEMTLQTDGKVVYFFGNPYFGKTPTPAQRKQASSLAWTSSITYPDLQGTEAILEKFVQWAKIAEEKKTEPFTKTVGKLDSAEYEMSWSGALALLMPTLADPQKAEMQLALLKQLPDAEKELAARQKKAAEEAKAFH